MTARVWCFLFIGWVSACLPVSVAHADTLRFATIDYCPFTCNPAKEAGKEGFMTDVLREAFQKAGHTLQTEMLPYVRAVASVQNGDYDGIVVVGKGYAPDLIYPDAPTVSQRVVFLVRADSSWRYAGIESLTEATIGVVRGFHYVDPDLISYLETNKDDEARVHVIHGQDTTWRGLRLLQGSRVTTYLEGEYSAMYELAKTGEPEALKVAGHTNSAFDDYTGFSPKNPEATRYARILSAALTEMRANGRLAEILRAYGITLEDQ